MSMRWFDTRAETRLVEVRFAPRPRLGARHVLLLALGALPWVNACGGSPASGNAAIPSSDGPVSSSSKSDSQRDARIAALRDERTRAETLRDLIAEFDDRAKNGTRSAEAIAFIEQYAGPVTNTYVEFRSSLPPQLREKVINLLVSFDVPVTIPAHVSAIAAYARGEGTADEAMWACQIAARNRTPELAEALLLGYQRIDMSDDAGRRYSRHLTRAMHFNAQTPFAQKHWPEVLLQKLQEPLVRPERFDDKVATRAFNNGLFWKGTALELLAELQVAPAARTILRVLMDNDQSELHPEAEWAWLRLGAAGRKAAEALLLGSDSELVAAAQGAGQPFSEPHVYYGAAALGNLGLPSSMPALVTASKRTRDPVSRVFIALAATRVSGEDDAKNLFEEVYKNTPPQLSLPGRGGALESLAVAAPRLFDPALAGFLLPRVELVHGTWARKGDTQRTLVQSAAALAQAEHLASGRKIAQRYGGRVGTPAFEVAEALVKGCDTKAPCYLAALLDPTKHAGEPKAVSLVAATHVGIYGGSSERDQLLAHLTAFHDPEVQERVADVIEHLSPKPSADLLQTLRARMEEERADPRSQNVAFSRLYFRLRAR